MTITSTDTTTQNTKLVAEMVATACTHSVIASALDNKLVETHSVLEDIQTLCPFVMLEYSLRCVVVPIVVLITALSQMSAPT